MLSQGCCPKLEQDVNVTCGHLVPIEQKICCFELKPASIWCPVIRIKVRTMRWWWCVRRQVISVYITDIPTDDWVIVTLDQWWLGGVSIISTIVMTMAARVMVWVVVGAIRVAVSVVVSAIRVMVGAIRVVVGAIRVKVSAIRVTVTVHAIRVAVRVRVSTVRITVSLQLGAVIIVTRHWVIQWFIPKLIIILVDWRLGVGACGLEHAAAVITQAGIRVITGWPWRRLRMVGFVGTTGGT